MLMLTQTMRRHKPALFGRAQLSWPLPLEIMLAFKSPNPPLMPRTPG